MTIREPNPLSWDKESWLSTCHYSLFRPLQAGQAMLRDGWVCVEVLKCDGVCMSQPTTTLKPPPAASLFPHLAPWMPLLSQGLLPASSCLPWKCGPITAFSSSSASSPAFQDPVGSCLPPWIWSILSDGHCIFSPPLTIPSACGPLIGSLRRGGARVFSSETPPSWKKPSCIFLPHQPVHPEGVGSPLKTGLSFGLWP